MIQLEYDPNSLILSNYKIKEIQELIRLSLGIDFSQTTSVLFKIPINHAESGFSCKQNNNQR